MFEEIVVALWAMLPAYVPNNAAVLFGGGRPIDGERVYRGNRLLGDGKTWRGTAGGTLTGVGCALLLNALSAVIPGMRFIPRFPAMVVIALPAGAMAGDLLASFLKRRRDHERGAAVPGLDQLDFLFGALVFTLIAAPGWFFETFTLPVIAVVLLITPVFHLSANLLAYRVGWKNEPY